MEGCIALQDGDTVQMHRVSWEHHCSSSQLLRCYGINCFYGWVLSLGLMSRQFAQTMGVIAGNGRDFSILSMNSATLAAFSSMMYDRIFRFVMNSLDAVRRVLYTSIPSRISSSLSWLF
ncbi:hypothetical protein SADUNF_Sadunf12G0015000 [Salix dunnii]|uniref:Uncharacterized protein n=1 Tax=Salix dunnii TaxID=1413687 RepID=A0A835JQA9_9ROSI|nr:hypothetical protein SADUNF_Sadunf12G0015000 [Salix dunnii]